MKFKVELVRRFHITDNVVIEADNADEAIEKAYQDFDTLKSKLPQHIYEWLEFDESDVNDEGEADESDILEYEQYLADQAEEVLEMELKREIVLTDLAFQDLVGNVLPVLMEVINADSHIYADYSDEIESAVSVIADLYRLRGETEEADDLEKRFADAMDREDEDDDDENEDDDS